MAQITGIATQTISRFELGKQIPKDVGVLLRLRDAANAAGLASEAAAFDYALMGYRMWPASRERIPSPILNLPYTPQEFRLRQIAGLVALYSPKVARSIEEAAEEFALARETVDEVIAARVTARNMADARLYSEMETEIKAVAARKIFQNLKKEGKQ